MQFSISLNQNELHEGQGLASNAWQIFKRLFRFIWVSNQYTVCVDEASGKVFLSTIGISNTTETKQQVKQAWISAFGCWLASDSYACFVTKQAMQEAQFRCLCRVLTWYK